jgi:CheY-like chemotaxis protein
MNKRDGLQNIRIDTAKATILCIDDEPDMIAVLAHLLLQAGYACEGCRDAATAKQSVQKRVPDLIVADINVGSDNGLELCQEMKAANDRLMDVPVIYLSGAEIPDVVRRSHAAGGTYFLRKPFDPRVLLDLIETSLWMPHIVRNRVHAGTRAQ